MARNLTYDIVNDDLTMNNYFALWAMIVNPKLKYQEALYIFGISDRSILSTDPIDGKLKKEKKNYKKVEKVKVINIISGKETIFQSTKDIELYFGIKAIYVSAYIADRKLYKGEYRFYRYEEDV